MVERKGTRSAFWGGGRETEEEIGRGRLSITSWESLFICYSKEKGGGHNQLKGKKKGEHRGRRERGSFQEPLQVKGGS